MLVVGDGSAIMESQEKLPTWEVDQDRNALPVRRFKVLLEWDAKDEVWVTYVPGLNLLSTSGETSEQALDSTHEAILGYLEAASNEDIPVPPPEAEAEVVELEVATS